MDCADAKLRMEPYATGNLASPDREEFEAHIAECEGCRLELDLARAGVSVSRPDPAAAPTEDIVRSGESGFGPGAAFGASSGLDETSFADVASQLSDGPPSTPGDFEHRAQPLAPTASVPPPPPPPDPQPPQAPDSRGATSSGSDARDYSLDALLADATPFSSGASRVPSPQVDPLARVVPAGTAGSLHGEPTPAPETPPARPASWDFEPAEVGRTGAPPEGSLFFAEEALARARDAGERRKGGAVRMALWVAGSAVGVALLVFAGWIALRHRPASDVARGVAEPYVVPPRQAAGETSASEGSGEPSSPATGAPSEPAPSEPPPEQAAAPIPETPQPAESSPRSAADESPLVSSASTVAPRSPLPEPAPPVPSRHATRPRAGSERVETPRAARTKSPEGTKAPASKRNGGVGAPGGAGPSTASRSVAGPAAQAPPEEPVRAPARLAPEGTQPPAAASEGTGHVPPAEHESRPPGEGAESVSEAPGVSTPPATTPLTGAPAGAGATPPEATSPKPTPAQPSTEAPAGAAPTPAPGAAAESPPPAPTRPIDRLHLATAAAEQRGDLRALRSMRDTWKNFLQRGGVGPDRIRAKRELADCLWAIQELTGRRSDQREALRAYRDYLLNAPAGGADARTVGRAKQLQDAVSESN